MKKLSVVALLLLFMLVAAGCDKEQPGGKDVKSPDSSTVTVNPKPKTDPVKIKVKLYYPDEQGEKLVAVTETVKTADKYRETVLALLNGPKDKKLIGAFPKNLKLLDIKVKDGLATVNFSRELTHRFVGGSTGELMLVATLVNTLTEFPDVKKVRILVEGKPIETIAGHLDLSEPVSRMDKCVK